MTPLQLIARMQAKPNVWHSVGRGWAFMLRPWMGPHVCVWGTRRSFVLDIGKLPDLLDYIDSL